MQKLPSNVHKERAGAIATTFGALGILFPFLWGLLEPIEPEKRKEAYVENNILLLCLRVSWKAYWVWKV